MAEPFVPLGEFVTTHGLDGWLKLNPFNPDTTALVPGTQVFVENTGGQSSMAIEASKPHGKQFLIKLHGVNGIDAARHWVGSTLLIDAQALKALEPGEYYHYPGDRLRSRSHRRREDRHDHVDNDDSGRRYLRHPRRNKGTSDSRGERIHRRSRLHSESNGRQSSRRPPRPLVRADQFRAPKTYA